MMTLAIVNEWVVTAIVTIDESQYPDYAAHAQAAIDITPTLPKPQIGWIFTGCALVPPAGYQNSMKITKLAFRSRFTFAELVAIQTAQQTNIPLQVLNDNLAVATYIDLTRQDTVGGVNMLVAFGLLTPARAQQILTTAATDTEIYQG